MSNAAFSAAGVAKLLTPLGWELLQTMPPYDEAQALVLGESLRKAGVEPELAAALLTQSRLRARAQAKFGEFADGMLFTPDGLEQATRLVVAACHAQRYLAAGCSRVADLTCGVGADSLAFAGAGLSVTACDIDEATAAIASWNLRMFDDVDVRCADGLAVARELDRAGLGLYADPARRRGQGAGKAGKRQGKDGHSGRVFDPSQYQPPLIELLALRDVSPALGIKVGPGIDHAEVPPDAEAQWVSVDGDVVECCLWFGPLAPDGPGLSALLLRTTPDGVRSRTVRRSGESESRGSFQVAKHQPQTHEDRWLSGPFEWPSKPPNANANHSSLHAGPVGQLLFEPDGAIIRAGLLDVAAAELGAHQLDDTIAYLTADHLPEPSSAIPLATAYRILDTMPFNVKALKSYLRERGVGRVTIKKRGTAVTPEQLRSQLALRGDDEATLVLTRVAGQQSALIVEPT